MPRLRVKGIDVATLDEGRGAPVLLMHGNPDRGESWRGVIDRLKSDFRCVAPDFPGFGASAAPPEHFDFLPTGQAGFWNEFAEAAKLDDPCIVVIHDLGGLWLLPWVAAFRERVRALVVTNTIFHRDYDWHFWARVWQTPVLGEFATRLSPRALFRRELHRGDPALPPDHADQIHAHAHRTMRRTVLRAYRAHADLEKSLGEWPDRLAEAIDPLPRAVLWGDLDPWLPRWMGDTWGARARHLNDIGHWVPVSRPGVVAEAVQHVASQAP